MASVTDHGLDAIRTWLRRYVDTGLLPGGMVLVARDGNVVALESYGYADLEAAVPIDEGTLFRIYSMTKPVTSVAALSLVEAGAMALDDPVAEFIPSFGDVRVMSPGGRDLDETEPLRHPVTLRHLLTHTSGLTYGATYGDGGADPVPRRYAELNTDFGPDDGPLEQVVERLATIPLLTQPGSAWTYGVSTDVLGRVMEVVSGQSLADLLGEIVLDPLGMKDTGFRVPESALSRFSALYEATENGTLQLVERPGDSPQAGSVPTLSGGAGLVSTAQDYFRFAEMLRLGGRLGSVVVLRPETVAQMTRNQLPGDLASMGQPSFNETAMDGVGFGLGVSVVVDPGRAAWQSSLGEFAWGGYASTAFWVDPVHAVTVVFLTQVTPSDRNAIRSELRALVHNALGPQQAGAHQAR